MCHLRRKWHPACRSPTAGIGRMWWRLLSSLVGSQNPWLAVRGFSLELRRSGSRWTPATWFVYRYGTYYC